MTEFLPPWPYNVIVILAAIGGVIVLEKAFFVVRALWREASKKEDFTKFAALAVAVVALVVTAWSSLNTSSKMSAFEARMQAVERTNSPVPKP